MMKKTILQTMIASVIMVLTFGSCLGENSNTFESANALAYIKGSDYGYKYAVTLTADVKNDNIDDLEAGRMYRIGYKVSSKNMNANQIFEADYVSLVGNGLALTKSPSLINVYDKPTIEDQIFPSKANVIFFWPMEDKADDVWAFSYSCMAYPEDIGEDQTSNNIELVAYLVEKNQTTSAEGGNTEDLKGNQAIVNLHVRRKNPNITITDPALDRKKSYQGEVSIDMSALRAHFENKIEFGEEKVSMGVVQFQYIIADKDGKKQETIKLGSLDLNLNPDFGMYVEKR